MPDGDLCPCGEPAAGWWLGDDGVELCQACLEARCAEEWLATLQVFRTVFEADEFSSERLLPGR
jgi:hypothetical protein